MEENNGFGYFLLGLGLGVAAGVLLAPRSGAETREIIRAKAEDSGDYLKARADESREYLKKRTADVKDSATDIYERGRGAVAKSRDNLNSAVEAGKQAYREAVSNFENSPSGEGV